MCNLKEVLDKKYECYICIGQKEEFSHDTDLYIQAHSSNIYDLIKQSFSQYDAFKKITESVLLDTKEPTLTNKSANKIQMSEQDKAKELIEFYSNITGFSPQSLNGWMLREMAIGEVKRLIHELECVDFKHSLESIHPIACLTEKTIPYYKEVIKILTIKY